MASTYSALKIELIATGEQSGTWGATTNVNLGDAALGEAITGSADVAFSSADVTITLTDTNTTQAARNLRLNLTGTSGGARNLILGSGCQIEKLYLVNNGLADAVTVKNTTGTGIAVAAGKSMFVFNNGTNVVEAVNYASSISTGAITATSITDSGLTSGRVTYATTGGLLTDSASLLFNGTALGVGGAGDAFGRGYTNIIGVTSSGTASVEINAGTGNSAYLDMGANGTRYFNINSNSTNTSLSTIGSFPLTFAINGSESMRIDTSGRLGIGISSPSYKLDVSSSAFYVASFIRSTSGASSGGIRLGNTSKVFDLYADSTGFAIEDETIGATRIKIDSSGNVGIGTSSPNRQLTLTSDCELNSASTVYHYFGPNGANLQGFIGYNSNGNTDVGARGGYSITFNTSTSGAVSERMRINTSGQLLVGTTSSNGASLVISTNSGTTNWNVGPYNSVATNFYITGNNLTNGVYLSGVTATSWSGLSDERAKDIIEPITNAINKVSTLRAVIGSYKSDETKTRKSFLIAQDVQAVLPEAVSVANEETGFLGLAYTDVIPLLVASIKEQQALIESLTQRIATLENK